MLPEKDVVRLQHMLEWAQEALGYARGRTRPDLDADRMLAIVLVHCLETVGEAAAQVSEPTRSALPDIPRRTLTGMRNRLVHVYHDINLDMVWKAVTRSLPPLARSLERALRLETP